eukprot:scaffold161645_cov59-Attheya_sp.AAC.2
MPKEKPVILPCHCREIVCFGKSQGPCIKCKAKDNISRDLMLGMCDTCDVCECTCAYAYKTDASAARQSSADVGGGISASWSQAFIGETFTKNAHAACTSGMAAAVGVD